MKDLTGKTFNCLTVTGYTQTNQGPRWTCMCSCGVVAYAKTHDLVASRKKSCGHLRTEHNKRFMARVKEMNRFKFKGHGDPYGWATIDDSLDELAGA